VLLPFKCLRAYFERGCTGLRPQRPPRVKLREFAPPDWHLEQLATRSDGLPRRRAHCTTSRPRPSEPTQPAAAAPPRRNSIPSICCAFETCATAPIHTVVHHGGDGPQRSSASHQPSQAIGTETSTASNITFSLLVRSLISC
jgi:hypothetical protein